MTSNTPKAPVNVPLVLTIIGYSLFITANTFNMREPSALLVHAHTLPDALIRAVGFAPFAVVSIALGVVILKSSHSVLRWLPVAAAGLLVTGISVLALAIYANGNPVFSAAALALLNCYSAVAFAAWIRCVMHLERDDIWLMVIASSVFAAVLHLVISPLADAISPEILFSTLSLGSLFFLFAKPLVFPQDNDPSPLALDESRVMRVIKAQGVMVVALGALGFVSGAMRIVLPGSNVQQAIAAEVAGVVLAGAILFFLVFVLKVNANIKATTLCSIPLVALGCMAAPFVSPNMALSLMGLATACYTIGLMLIQITSYDFADGNPRIATAAYSLLCGCVCVFNLVGFCIPVGSISAHLNIPDAVTVSFVGMLVLIIALSIERISILKDSPAPIGADPTESAVKILTDKFLLSEKESQILLLMASGRDIPSIAKQLVLAESTIRTHNKHIFKKLRVHSRQECIDLVLEHRPPQK